MQAIEILAVPHAAFCHRVPQLLHLSGPRELFLMLKAQSQKKWVFLKKTLGWVRLMDLVLMISNP